MLHALMIVLLPAALCLGADPPNEKPDAGKSSKQKPAERQEPAADKKPSLKVEKDGFPSGHGTPEGAACDLARAFINRDAKLFKQTCIAPFGGGENRKSYEDFLEKTAAGIKAEAEKKEPSPGGPKSIGKVFQSRQLSKEGPASAGFALHNFQEIEFVDVGCILQNGEKSLTRTLVIKDANGKWWVHPAPDIEPLLSAGLNDESKSEHDFSEAYDIQK